MTGTRPLACSMHHSTTRLCSACDKVGLSPVVPTGTRPLVPSSICQSTRLRNAFSSREPLSKGVTSAVNEPLKLVLTVMIRSFDSFRRPGHALLGRTISGRLRPMKARNPPPAPFLPWSRQMLSSARLALHQYYQLNKNCVPVVAKAGIARIELLAPDTTSDRHRGGGASAAGASLRRSQRRARLRPLVRTPRQRRKPPPRRPRRRLQNRHRRQPPNLHRRPTRNRPRRLRPNRKPLPQPRNRRSLRRQPVRSRRRPGPAQDHCRRAVRLRANGFHLVRRSRRRQRGDSRGA